MEDDMYDEFLLDSLDDDEELDEDGYVFGLPVLMASEDWVTDEVDDDLPF